MSTMGQEPRPGSSVWTKLTIALVIIAVVVSIVTYAMVGIFLNPNIPDPGRDIPTAALTQARFENPYEGNTTNSGGWVATVKDLAGPTVPLKKLTVWAGGTIPGGSRYFGMEGVARSTSDVLCEGANGSWYLHRYPGTPLKFMDNGTLTDLTNSTAELVGPEEMATIEGASLIFFDNDGNGNLSIGDSVRAFQDVDADGGRDMATGHRLVLETKGGRIGEVTLGP